MNHTRLAGLRARVGIAAAALWVGSALIGGACARAGADDVPAAIVESVQNLVDAQGQEWLASRDAFLQLPASERAAALEYLARADATKEEKTLALILRTRIERPDDVAAYEAGLARDLTDPAISRGGDPIYGHYAPLTNSENYALNIEHIWKRSDLAEELRKSRYIGLNHRVLETDSLLILLERDPDRSATVARAFSSVPDSGNDPRVPAALFAAYQRSRTEIPRKPSRARIVMISTASLGTPLARDAVLRMHSFERDLMLQGGRAPWNDRGEAEAAYAAAFKEHKRATQKQFADNAQRTATLEALKEQELDAMERFREVTLWQAYADAYQRLRDAGVPVEAPPDP